MKLILSDTDETYQPSPLEQKWNEVEKQLPPEDFAFVMEYLRRKRGDKGADRKKFQRIQKKIEQIFIPKKKTGRPSTYKKKNKPAPDADGSETMN